MNVSVIPWSVLPLAGRPRLAAALATEPCSADDACIEWLDGDDVRFNRMQIFRRVIDDKPFSVPLDTSSKMDGLGELSSMIDLVFEHGEREDPSKYQGRSCMGGIRYLLGESFVPSCHRVAIRYLRGRELQMQTYEYVAFTGERRHACALFCEIALEVFRAGGGDR